MSSIKAIQKMTPTANILPIQLTNSVQRVQLTHAAHQQLKEYLAFLLENDLVEEFPQQIKTSGSGEKLVYRISEKGLCFLQISQEFENLIGLD